MIGLYICKGNIKLVMISADCKYSRNINFGGNLKSMDWDG
jgi:hypothetical protein